jgi:hypothetical protein
MARDFFQTGKKGEERKREREREGERERNIAIIYIN